MKLYSPKAAERILRKHGAEIEAVSARYAVPVPFIRALLYTELIRIDLFDPLADLLVSFNLRLRLPAGPGLLRKRDSSTGYGQIFGFVAINAVNFACEQGIESRSALSLPDRPLDPADPEDLLLVWPRLRRDPAFNIALSTLNLIAAAHEVTGRIDFSGYTPEEIQRMYTRYNGTIPEITPYGAEAYRHYLRYAAPEPDCAAFH